MKKLISMFGILLLSASFLAGCAEKSSSSHPQSSLDSSSPDSTNDPEHEEDYELTLACPADMAEHVRIVAESYLEREGWTKVTVALEAIETGDVVSAVMDWSRGPDIYAFCSDSMLALLQSEALDPLPQSSVASLKESVSDARLQAAFADSVPVAYPYTGDNGYFLYYDASLFSGKEESLSTLEGILDVCKAAGREFCYPLGDPFYSMAFLQTFGAGYEAHLDEGLAAIEEVDSSFASKEGLLAARMMADLLQDPAVLATTSVAAPSENNNIGAVVDGTWSYQRYADAVGEENLGVAPLPWVTREGRTKRIRSYLGYKLFGVNPHPSGEDKTRLSLLHGLAAALLSSEAQEERLERFGIPPVEQGVLEGKDIDVPWIEAIVEQAEAAIPQTLVPESLWQAPLPLYEALSSGDSLTDERLLGLLSDIDSLLSD